MAVSGGNPARGLIRRPVFWFLAAVAAIGFVGYWPLFSVLRISHHLNGQTLYCARMHLGEEFVLAYIHSVNRRPVYDTLRAAGDRLVIVGSRFDSFGAGMPDGSDGRLSVAPDGWLVYRVERPTPEVVVRVGRVAEQTLHIKGQELALVQLAPPGSPLRLQVARVAIVDLIKGRCAAW
ncbi:MAG: DUF1850 domain-containing protein [Desulfobacterales bacterium]|nr:DUF1850 domain-containing protein [Desulfobacterales bacterium]